MQTVSGREISVTTAFRLPLQDYQKAQELAERESVRLSVVMRRLVAEGLAVQQERGLFSSSAQHTPAQVTQGEAR